MNRLEALLEAVRSEVVREEERVLVARAGQFLRSLDPESQLGMWFDAFAASQSSRMAAALVYVREVMCKPEPGDSRSSWLPERPRRPPPG
jgi:hypothetical protein